MLALWSRHNLHVFTDISDLNFKDSSRRLTASTPSSWASLDVGFNQLALESPEKVFSFNPATFLDPIKLPYDSTDHF